MNNSKLEVGHYVRINNSEDALDSYIGMILRFDLEDSAQIWLVYNRYGESAHLYTICYPTKYLELIG